MTDVFANVGFAIEDEAVVSNKKDNVTQEESDSQEEEKLVVCL